MKKPLVSIIMPVYNGEKFIGEALDSILGQTYQRFELYIVNDRSTDNTYNIITEYQKRSPGKIHLIHLKKRHGAFGAMNMAYKHIKGDFIAPMDSDDISAPERIEKEVEFLRENPEVVVVGSFARIIDSNGNIVGEKVFGTTHRDIYSSFFTVHPIVHPACMIRRSLLPRGNKLYWNEFGVNDDYYTFFKLLNSGKFSNIPEFLFSYRVHSGNSSLKKLKEKFFNTVKIRLLAIKDLGYKPNISGIFNFFLQIIFVSLAPEGILLSVYLYIKGIYMERGVMNPFSKSFPLPVLTASAARVVRANAK